MNRLAESSLREAPCRGSAAKCDHRTRAARRRDRPRSEAAAPSHPVVTNEHDCLPSWTRRASPPPESRNIRVGRRRKRASLPASVGEGGGCRRRPPRGATRNGRGRAAPPRPRIEKRWRRDLRTLHVPLCELGAAILRVEAEHKDIVVLTGDGSVCIEVRARPDRDGGFALCRKTLVGRIEASRLVRILQPGVGDGGPADDGFVVGVIPIARVIAEERLDLGPFAALPRRTLEPARPSTPRMSPA